MKEQFNKLNKFTTDLANVVEMLNTTNDEKKLNIYRDTIWEITKQIRNTVGSPNSRKN